MSKKMQFALGITLVGLFVASIAAIAPKAVKAAIATLIRDQDNAARHPFTTFCAGGTSCSTPSIPPGEQVVVETINENLQVLTPLPPAGTRVIPDVTTTVAGQPLQYDFSTLADSGISSEYMFFSATQSVRLYADPGTQIKCEMFSTVQFANALFGCSVSGYFVTLP